jgi:hypothetical protein
VGEADGIKLGKAVGIEVGELDGNELGDAVGMGEG